MVELQDAAYNQRVNPRAEEDFWEKEEKDSPGVAFTALGMEQDQQVARDHTTPALFDSSCDEEEEGEGTGGESDDGMNEDSDEDGEQDEDEGGSDGEHGDPLLMRARVTLGKKKEVGWKGRGISALFLVDKEFNNLAAVYLFKVIHSDLRSGEQRLTYERRSCTRGEISTDRTGLPRTAVTPLIARRSISGDGERLLDRSRDSWWSSASSPLSPNSPTSSSTKSSPISSSKSPRPLSPTSPDRSIGSESRSTSSDPESPASRRTIFSPKTFP